MTSFYRLICEKIISHADVIASANITSYDFFDLVYGGLPVEIDAAGEYVVTWPESFATGVMAEDVDSDPDLIADLDDLASALNLEPWSLAVDYGWDEAEIDPDAFLEDPSDAEIFGETEIREAALAALSAARQEAEEQKNEEAEYHRFMREEREIHDREAVEMRLADQGIAVEFFGGDTLEQAADELCMPMESETARLYFERKLPKAEAQRRAEIILDRHENTDYDSLIARGVDRDAARGIIHD